MLSLLVLKTSKCRQQHTHHVTSLALVAMLTFTTVLRLNCLAYRQLARTLTDLCQIGPTEAVSHLCQVLNVHILNKNNGFIN